MTARSNILANPGRSLTALTNLLVDAASGTSYGQSKNTGLLPKPATFEHICQLLWACGYNSTSYLTLEHDKQHVLHNRVAGVRAYSIHNRVAIAAGEPVCSQVDLPVAIDEFINFAYQHDFKHLHGFKQKFHPHFWESKYLTYQRLSFVDLDAIVQAVQGQGIGQIVWSLVNQPIL